MKKIILCLSLLGGLYLNAQNTQYISQNIVRELSLHQKSTLKIPLSNTESVEVELSERPSSIQGSRVFVVYSGDELAGALSYSQNKLSGDLNVKNHAVKITTDEAGILQMTTQESNDKALSCGVKEYYDEERLSPVLKTTSQTNGVSSYSVSSANKMDFTEVQNTNVFRVYRMAMFIDNYYYTHHFKSNVEEVRKFWNEQIALLNEMYGRELGVRFEIINDERLIAETPEQNINAENKSMEDIIRGLSLKIYNKLGQSDENFDTGIYIGKADRYGGLADTTGIYNKNNKANACAHDDVLGRIHMSIAHEIGHLFGSKHTHSKTDNYNTSASTYKTEPNYGYSIMSYSSERNMFFSLPSLQIIKEQLKKSGYYKNRTRTAENLVKFKRFTDSGVEIINPTENYSYGFENTNAHIPTLDKSKLQKVYQIPKGSSFQFNLSATDADGDKLLYYAHPISTGTYAVFPTYKPTENSTISFKANTNVSENYFWLAAMDERPNGKKDFAPQYDIFETKVEFVDGTPLTATVKKDSNYRFYTGQKASITWNYDEKTLNGYNVKILMSKDNGETYPYVLKEHIPIANKSTDFIVPLEVIGDFYGSRPITFKIEVENHITYNVVESSQHKGLYYIKDSNIKFTGENNVIVNQQNDFDNAENLKKPTAKCSNQTTPVTLSNDESLKETATPTEKVLVWQATCNGATSYFRQKIILKKDDTTLATTENKEVSKSISLYPNPVSNEFSLKGIEEIKEVKIFDFTGRIVKSFGKQEVYNISDLAKGVYIVLINQKETIKIIKK